MSDFKQHVISFLLTFVASFFVVFGGIIANSDAALSKETIVAALIAGILSASRTVAKVIQEYSALWLTRFLSKKEVE